MEQLVKYFGFLKRLRDFQFKGWLDKHAYEFLTEVGVKAGQMVLDFGCGSGTYTIPAAKLVGKDGRVYALDINKKALDKMEEKSKQEGLKNIKRIDSAGGEEIPIEDETIDHVLLIDVLQEIDDRALLFDEVYRILKPNGVVTVYPMHIKIEEIEDLARSKSLILEDKKISRTYTNL
ncbi:MAG: class I SAM-dependent methyltransferase [Candidatus Bathyarchaeia archaeon]